MLLTKLRYRHTVGKVFVNGSDANMEQIKSGMAWWYRDYANEQSPDDRAKYEQAEQVAKQNRVGLWRDKNQMPSWDFGHGGVKQSQIVEPCPCGSGLICTGPKGGNYCFTPTGGKS